MTAVDTFLTDLTARLHVGRRAQERITAEVRDHLEEAIERRVQLGTAPEPAAEAAVAAFGSAATLAAQLNVEAGTRAMRRAPALAFAAGLTAIASFLLAATTQPTTTASTSAGADVQVAFFAAVLAFQVAVVAGICAAARAAAVWRSRGVRSEDRTFVLRCAALSMTSLAIAAIGWATAAGLSADRIAHPNTLTLVTGLAGMVAAPIAGGVLVRRLRVNEADDAPDHEPVSPGLLGVGDGAIDLVRQHPVVSCAAATLLAAAQAMSRAETTVTGALPWGIAQAVAVVVGFVVLGPGLDLRRAKASRLARR